MGSIFALLILILKFLFKEKLQIRLINCLWIFLIVRLLIPYAPQTSFSIYNLYHLPGNKIIQDNYIKNYSMDKSVINGPTDKFEEVSNDYASVKPKNIDANRLSYPKTKMFYFEICAAVWMLICIILTMSIFITTAAFYAKLRKEKMVNEIEFIEILNNCRQKMHINKHVEIISTDIVKSPAIFGFIHPKILLPSNINKVISQEQLSCIIFHELAHLKRKDMLVDFLVSILKIMHWFNPILWYAFFKMEQDKELACDEMALNYCNCSKYGYTIITLLEAYKESNPAYGLDCIINNKKEIKRRITMISLFKKSSYRWTAVSITVLLVIGGIILTNPRNITAVYNNNIQKTFNNIEELSIQSRTFKGKILVIKNPSKVEVGYTKELLKNNKTTGELAGENTALCAINASYISTEDDINSKRTLPETDFGIIIHNGNVVYNNPGNVRYCNIAGFTDKNVLISGQYSIEDLKKMNVTEAVNSQASLIEKGKPLLKEDEQLAGIDPRTAIAQRKDGTVLMAVIDGRSVDSVGGSLFQLQQVLLENGAYTAAVLDGGSSSTMYYKGNIINKPAYAKGQRPVSSIFMIGKSE
ncbi:M56 family metallopeptidase [Clostridium sp. WILCCON 0269]|uniref:M56 family metallopeptidase n=1 Tax=Candidatus Clostridium eludens TaxID=3381663 RepID=A0ABW8SG05_9CLOT